MGVSQVKDVIQVYEPDVQDFLNQSHKRSIAYEKRLPIDKSIDNIVSKALENVSGKIKDESKFAKSDTFLFGDIHGRLDMFVQDLFAAGLIDKNGNWAGKNKSCVLLGDLIQRGPYSAETLVYSMALQKQATEQGGKFHVLLGNHEHLLLNNKPIDFNNIDGGSEKFIKSMLKDNIQKGDFTLAYADNSKNLISVHGGLDKGILLKAVASIDHKARHEFSSLKYSKRKISSEDIYKVMGKYGITLE